MCFRAQDQEQVDLHSLACTDPQPNRCIPGYTPEEMDVRCDAVDRVNAILVNSTKDVAHMLVSGFRNFVNVQIPTWFGPEIEPQEIKGAIFDVDGTLLDTMPLFYPSWQIAGNQWDLNVTEEMFYCSAGVPIDQMVRKFYRDQNGQDCDDKFVEAFLQTKKVTFAGVFPS